MEFEGSFPHIQVTATCQGPEPVTEIIFLLIMSLQQIIFPSHKQLSCPFWFLC